MTVVEALRVSAATLERIEESLTAANERDLRQAIHLARLEVTRLLEEEIESPGTHASLAD